MIVTKKKTVLYFVQMTDDQRTNLIKAIAKLIDHRDVIAQLDMTADEFESVNDIRISLLNA